jgi:hypothetical protein
MGVVQVTTVVEMVPQPLVVVLIMEVVGGVVVVQLTPLVLTSLGHKHQQTILVFPVVLLDPLLRGQIHPLLLINLIS